MALPALGGIPRNSGAALLESDDSLPELLALYNRFAARYNACFMRRDGKYFPLDPYRTQNYFYLWRDESGEARGYFQARPNGRTLDILELVYLDRASLLGLLGFMRMFEGQFDTVSFRRLEQGSPVELLIDCDRSASFGAYDAAMGRVLDVPACLRRMRAEAGQTLSLRITDDTCPKNTGLYRLAFTDGETVVEKCAEGEADASMTVNAFSLLALAGASEAELDYVDGLTVYGKRPLLVRLFARRPINLFEQF